MKLLWLFIAFIAVAGCAMSRPIPLEESDPMSVRECRPVGSYPGPYGYRFWGPPPVLGDFKYLAASAAADAGATHIYWREAVLGYYGQTRIVGYAFDCRGVAMPRYQGDYFPY